MKKIIGVISDTHGLLRPKALNMLSGSDIIIHAGDIGEIDIIHKLEDIAPLYAVRGNTDRSSWPRKIPSWEIVQFEGLNIYVRHILGEMDIDPASASIDIVITGHTHMPKIDWKNGILFFNPGSAGPIRDRLPVTVGKIIINESGPEPEIIRLM
ncbi:metallophosphoesterase family protein [Desulforegula conservatrix]|uniref:metallophosphoesterase family protein n=1 Tax=Desulforegula conservatrix TaxID=153026 RepID=UPI0004131AC2|nr:metallophosphoesterase family protein [Desulforegula conservatrix]